MTTPDTPCDSCLTGRRTCSPMSPPYYRQRDYEVAGQIGQEGSVQEYLERLWAVFDQARRC